MSESPRRRGILAILLFSRVIPCLLVGIGIGYLVGHHLDTITSHSRLESTAIGLMWGVILGIFAGLVLDARFPKT
jgi:F0F1-type ATP synthase assembly protein I